MNRYLTPLGVFIILVLLLGWGLFNRDMLNPSQQKLDSMLVGKTVPQFVLKQLHDQNKTFSSAEMKGKVWLVNVWASWCVACVQEHPILTAISKDNIRLYGLNYQDQLSDATNWLKRHGDPYVLSAIDDNRASLDFGVYGVPETFVVDKEGVIRHKFTGPISGEQYLNILKPLLKELEG